MAISAIGAVIRGRGRDDAVRVLRIAVEAKVAPLTQIEIKAIDLLLFSADYRGQISDGTLVMTISVMGRKAYSEANVFRAAHPTTPLWKALAITWFKGRRSAALKSQSSTVLKIEASKKPLGKTTEKIARIVPAPTTDNEDRPRSLLPPDRKGQSVADGAKRDDRVSLRGWITGNHLRRCGPCGSPFVGGLRATECADCAYRAEAVSKAS